MKWKACLIPRRISGIPITFKTFFIVQDNERVRFFIFYGPRIWFTRSYATIHDGLKELPGDFEWAMGWRKAA